MKEKSEIIVEEVSEPIVAEADPISSRPGVGRLAEIIGVEQAEEFFAKRKAAQNFWREHFLRRYGAPAVDVCIGPPRRYG